MHDLNGQPATPYRSHSTQDSIQIRSPTKRQGAKPTIKRRKTAIPPEETLPVRHGGIVRNPPKLSTLLREISWSNNRLIMTRCKSIDEKEFYIRLSASENYSFRELDRQISTAVFERTMLGNQKLSPLLRELHPAIEGAFRDSYIFEFLNLSEPFSESDLQNGLIRGLKDFILELGKDFLFAGENYRLQVGITAFSTL